jgi:hypothetical protein
MFVSTGANHIKLLIQNKVQLYIKAEMCMRKMVSQFICVYFVTNDQITNPPTLIVGQLVIERNVAPLLSTDKIDNSHCDPLL